MQTRQMSYVTEIARQKSLSGAARALGISQPALSQFLSVLEAELGFPLFFSYRKQLLPTEAGAVYLNAAEQILAIRDRTYRQIRACAASSSGCAQVRIGMVGGPTSAQALGAAIPAVSRRFPGAELVTPEAPIFRLKEWLQNGSVDAAIIGLDSEEDWNLPFYQYLEAELYVIVPRIFPLTGLPPEDPRHPAFVRLQDLRDIPFIRTGAGRVQARTEELLFEQAAFSPVVAYKTDNLYAAAGLCAEGFGACFALDHQLPALDQGRCRVFALPEHPKIRFGISLARPQEPEGILRELVKELILQQMRDESRPVSLNESSRRLLADHSQGTAKETGASYGYTTD